MARRKTYEQEAHEYYRETWRRGMRDLMLTRRLAIKGATLAALGGSSALSALLAACAPGSADRADVSGRLEEGRYEYSPFPLVEKYHWRKQPFAEPPFYGGTMVHVQSQAPRNWNHVKGVGAGNSGWGGQAFQTLLALPVAPDANMDELTLEGTMLESIEPSPDYMVWTAKLYDNIWFHEFPEGWHKKYKEAVKGRQCTADDCVQSLRIMITEGFYGPSFFEFVDRLETVDRTTFRIYMKRPILYLPETLAVPYFWIFRPEDYANEELFNFRPVGTAPMGKIRNSEFRVETVQEAHERSHMKDWKGRPLPYMRGMYSAPATDVAAMKAALRTGQNDLFLTTSKDDLDDLLSTNPELLVQVSAYNPPSPIGFMFNYDTPLFRDVRVRRALSMGIDRKKMVELVTAGAAVPWYPVSFNFMGLKQPLDWPDMGPYHQYNPEEAKRLLAEAGYRDGLDLELMIGSTPSDTELLAKEMWEQIGVRLHFNQQESGVVTTARQQRKWKDLIGFAWTIGYDLDHYVFNTLMPGRSVNYGGIDDPELTKLVEAQRFELDPDQRMRLAKQINDRWLDQVYHLAFYNYTRIWIRQPWILNSRDHLFGTMYGWYSQQTRAMTVTDKAPAGRAGKPYTGREGPGGL